MSVRVDNCSSIFQIKFQKNNLSPSLRVCEGQRSGASVLAEQLACYKGLFARSFDSKDRLLAALEPFYGAGSILFILKTKKRGSKKRIESALGPVNVNDLIFGLFKFTPLA